MEHRKTTSDISSNTGRRGVSQTSAMVTVTTCILAVLLVQSPDAAGQSISVNHDVDVEIEHLCDGWVNFNGSSVLVHEAPKDAVVSSIDISYLAYHPDGNERLRLSLFDGLSDRADVFDGSEDGGSNPWLNRDHVDLSLLVGRPVNGWYTFGGCQLGESVDGAFLDRWAMTVHYVVPGGGLGLNEFELIVPASAHITGVGGSKWRTDLEIKATGPEGATYAISLLEQGRNNDDPLQVTETVGPGQAIRYVDAVMDLFGYEGAAALSIIPVSGRILSTSRTYDDSPAGTHGAFVPALPATRVASFGDEAVILQMSHSPAEDGGYRTNLGVVNLTAKSLVVTIDLFQVDGSSIGTSYLHMKPREYNQINHILGRFSGARIEDAYAVVTTPTVDGAFVAYASVIDNVSQDSIFIPAQVVRGGYS